MTVNNLLKLLEKAKADGHGRCKVNVDKGSLWDGNDSWAACDVASAAIEWISICDDDGGASYTKAGVERMKRVLLLKGIQ